MVFSSIIFTFVFLPLVLLFYHIVGKKYKNIILLISSLIFYAYGEKTAFLLMLASICVNYCIGRLIADISSPKTRKIWLIIDIIANLSILYVFKYLDYTITLYNHLTKKDMEIFNIALPIGISFFTFQAMSYVIDVYRGDAEVEKNILNVGLYISFFPQLVAGPIVRYNSIAGQLKNRTETLAKFGEGAKRFLCGFSKKIIIANNLAMVTDKFYQDFEIFGLPVGSAWICSIAYSLQILFDFSGYSDMAIGLGKMFGFDFQENFNYPYISKTVTEFWRRWHISLSRWFRDYVYIPLGGSRVSVLRNIFNLFIVWMLTGLWHGANLTFVVWGLLYFAVLMFEKFILKPDNRNNAVKVLWQIMTLFIVNICWILFRTESFYSFVRFVKTMFGMYSKTLCDEQTVRMLKEYGIFIVAGIIFSTPVIPFIENKLNISSNKILTKINAVAAPVIYILIFLWSVSFLILGAHNPFIYFNF